MNLGFGNQIAIQLDPKQYEPNAAAVLFAETVSEEIEARRVQLGGVKGGQVNARLSTLWMGQPITKGHHANRRGWYVFLTDRELMKACCLRLNVSTIQFLEQCMDILNPPNWETLFWMQSYLETVKSNAILELRQDLREDEQKKQLKKEMGRAGGKAKYRKHNIAREFIVSEWQLYQNDYEQNKSAFARDYSRRIKNEFGIDVTDKTIREVWLLSNPG